MVIMVNLHLIKILIIKEYLLMQSFSLNVYNFQVSLIYQVMNLFLIQLIILYFHSLLSFQFFLLVMQLFLLMLDDQVPISFYVIILKLIHILYFFILLMFYLIIILYLQKMNLIQEFNKFMLIMVLKVYNNNHQLFLQVIKAIHPILYVSL